MVLRFPPRWSVGSNPRSQIPKEALIKRVQREAAVLMVKSSPFLFFRMLKIYRAMLNSVCSPGFQERPRVVSCTTWTCSWSITAPCSARGSLSSTCGKCQKRARKAAVASTRTSSPQPRTQTRPLPWPLPFCWTNTATLWYYPRAGMWAGTGLLGVRTQREGSGVRERCQTTWKSSLRPL